MAIRRRTVDKSLFRNYLKKAEECIATARECLEKERWNSTAVNAIHCGISACGALTVFMTGTRHAGDRHEDAISLLETLEIPRDILTKKSRQLSSLLRIKTAAEYEERLISENDARQSMKDAERFFKWVEELLKA